MRKSGSGIAWNSITFKLVISFLAVTVPLVGLLFYNNFYAIHVVREQVAKSNKNMMSLYMGQIDNNLEDINKYLISIVSSSYDIQIMDRPQSADDYMMAKTRLSDKLTTDILMYKADSYFVYSAGRKELMDTGNGRNTEMEKLGEIRAYIRQELDRADATLPAAGDRWFSKKIHNDYYLFRFHRFGDTIIGARVNIKTLMLPLTYVLKEGNGYSFFVTDRGEAMATPENLPADNVQLNPSTEGYRLAGKQNRYLMVGESSAMGDFGLVALIPNGAILQDLPYLNKIVFIISFLGLLLVPGFLWFLRRTMQLPLKRLLSVMKRVGDGNVQLRIDTEPASDEFQLLNRSFNIMMGQIEELKIHVYEEQLNKQKAELQHLQLQINPHFFLNTLNILYNLALVKDFELIKEMTQRLVRYFRYMFRSNLTFLPLQEELEHVRNYIRIQELRFQKSLNSRIAVPESLLKAYVPPLVIQTFVENAIKHSSNRAKNLTLDIEVEWEEAPCASCMLIRVRDTGPGFSEEVLKELRQGNRIIDEQGEHIGIWNVWHRLRILYGARAGIQFENGDPSGAVVTVRIPLENGPDPSAVDPGQEEG